jgi:hypothetical protein
MNLEAIEQKCLAYLMQVSRPLVSVDQLLRYVHRDAEMGDVTERALLEFLRKHELFTVLDPIGLAADAEGARALEKLGIPTGASVMLETRVPTKRQLAEQMNEQLDTLLASLNVATQESVRLGDEERLKVLIALRERTVALKERLREFD